MNQLCMPHDLAAVSPTPHGRILVVEEDRSRRHAIIDYLAAHNWAAIGSSERDLARNLRCHDVSLVMLNARVKSGDALSMLREIRVRSFVPVIMYKDGDDDGMNRVVSLELGADDFISGTINLHELLARARAILRRQEFGRLAPPPMRGGFRFGGWELAHATRTITCPNGRKVPLTRSEYALLCALLEAPCRTLSRVHLLRATRTHEDIYDRSIDVQILRLRRKLGVDAGALILTERGFGYRLEAEVETLY